MSQRIVSLAILSVSLAGCTKITPVDEVHPAAGANVDDLAAPSVAEGDWPWWRGPAHNGAMESPAPTEWSESQNVLWKTPLPGRGHSSPTVVGDRIYLATADDDAQTQSLLALDRQDGKILWEQTLSQGGFPAAMHHNSTHANGTVACDGERLIIAFLHDDAVHAYAVSLEGEPIWERELGAFNSKFGYAPSPTIYKSWAIFAGDNQGGGWLAAVHRGTGDLVWRTARPAVSTYSSPVVANVGGRDLLLISGADAVAAFDPVSGEEIWSCPGTTEATCATMVWDDERVFATGGFPGSETICVDAASGEKVWSNSKKCYEQSMLVVEDCLVAVTNNGVFCWDAKTGQQRWAGRVGGKFSASPVLAGSHIYASNEGGTTFVIAADTQEFRLVAENQLGNEVFATPTICGGRIYARVAFTQGGRREWLYCIGEATADEVGR